MEQSIRSRLRSSFFLLAIGPLILVGLLLSSRSYHVQTHQAIEIQKETARRISTQVDSYLNGLKKELEQITHIRAIDSLPFKEQEGLLRELLSYQRDFEELTLIDSSGKEKIFLHRYQLNRLQSDRDYSQQPFFEQAKEGMIFWGKIEFHQQRGEPLLPLSVPIINKKKNQLTNILTTQIRFRKIWDIIAQMQLLPGTQAYIINQQGDLIAHRNPSLVLRDTRIKVPTSDGIQEGINGQKVVLVRHKLTLNNQTLMVVVERSLSEALSLAIDTIEITLLIILISLSVAILLVWLFSRRIIAPILDLSNVVHLIKDGNLDERVKVHYPDEIGDLANAFNKMTRELQKTIRDKEQAEEKLSSLNKNLEERVQERTQALEKSLFQLQETQDQLIQSEKMAALGNLVAGVAHEINTPLGIGITAVSYLREKIDEVSTLMQSTKLKRSHLEKFIQNAGETAQMIETNLHRGAELITSFKQVSVDQMNSKIRDFNLQEYLEEIILSMQPEFKRTAHQIVLNCPEDISLQSKPGAIYQVINNFMMNSLLHGFEQISAGEIHIEAELQDKNLILRYRDNGIGMDQATVAKVFDPFFTTKRGQGGTGLGLHIVFNLVTQTLQGKIHCSSNPGQGVLFEITIPQEIPLES